MTAAENKETVRRMYEAMERGDRSVFGASVHPDYVWRFPGHYSWSGAFEGRETIQRDLLTPLFGLFQSEYKGKAINLIAEGDFVVAEVRGDVMTKRGERYHNEYCFIFRFKDGKIVEVIEYCDSDHIERVLGSYEDAVKALNNDAE
ncbi:MAG: nuclear transport factor 2 family protein [Hyphomicrobiaceae bacterium]|nr:nuclear transport factor 2 family protein [Hyphomicrobiaceae bacterium]